MWGSSFFITLVCFEPCDAKLAKSAKLDGKLGSVLKHIYRCFNYFETSVSYLTMNTKCNTFGMIFSLLVSNIADVKGYMPVAAPADLTGMIIGLSVGLPFTCFTSMNLDAAKTIYHDLFNNKMEDVKMAELRQFEKNVRNSTIECPEDLNCEFNNKRCQWFNQQYENLCNNFDYFIAKTEPQNYSMLEALAGNKHKPNGAFAIATLRESNGILHLKSAQIPTHPGVGYVDINYWLSEPVKLRLCIRVPHHEDKTLYINFKCSAYLTYGKKHRARFVINSQPKKKKFSLALEASNFVVEQGSMIMLDSLSYSSDLNKENCKSTKLLECDEKDCTVLEM